MLFQGYRMAEVCSDLFGPSFRRQNVFQGRHGGPDRTGLGRRLYLSQARRALAKYYPITTDLRANHSAHVERPVFEK